MIHRLSRTGFAVLLALACSSDKPAAPVETCTIRGLSLGQTTFTMVVGQDVSVPSVIDQAGCRTLPAVVWTSSDPAVVSASSDGTVTAIGVGTATVTARLDGRNDQASATVTVRGRVLGLSVTPGAATVDVGSTIQLGATVSADPGTPGAVRWSSSDPSRATVESTGRVAGVAAGTATITATADADTTRRAHMVVTVRPRVRTLTVTPERDTVFVADTLTLRIVLQGDSGVVRDVTWRSSQLSVASVSPNGLVTAVSAGEAELIATSVFDTTRKARATLLVLPRVLGVTVNPEDATLDVGATRALVSTVTGDPGISTAVTWHSSNPLIASVSGSGVVSGVAAGSAVITVRSVADTSRFARATVTVRARILGIAVTPSTLALTLGGTGPLTATVTGDPGASLAVSWRSANAAVASVSASGVVTGIGAGTTAITAVSAADTSKRASATVTVTPPAPPPPPPPPPPPAEALCFGADNSNDGQRVTPTHQLQAGGASCVSSQLDVLVGQSSGAYALVDGAQVSATWQLPTTSVANFISSSDALAVTGLAPGVISVGASSAGKAGTLVIRVLGSPPAGFCLSTSSGGPCVFTATGKAGQGVTIYAVAGGQPVAARVSVLNGNLAVPPHLVTALTFVPPVPGVYLIAGTATAGGASAGMAVTVTP